jgi:D-alanyl-D-alanine carboxypeptidase
MNRYCAPWFALIVCVVVGTGCGSQIADEDPNAELAVALQTLLDQVLENNDGVPAVALHVDAPRIGLSWGGAAGVADPSTGEPMTPDHPVRIASNTKTYIAAAILRLAEDGRLHLDDPIADHLPADYVDLLASDGYLPDETTVRHLLTHTSGFFDYTNPPQFVEIIQNDPTHRWTRTEQLEAAVEWGDPLGDPGTVYFYADTNYILLGEILARVTGRPMAAAVRYLVDYEKLGLHATWFETLEAWPQDVPKIAHQFWGTFDANTVDPSVDLYGGGGVACTMGDLARFMGALFRGEVYTDAATADVMLTTLEGVGPGPGEPGAMNTPGPYRMGVWIEEVDGLTTYRHTGFWGTSVSYVPSLDVTIAATVNQNHAKGVLTQLVQDALAVVREAVESETPA